jgi:hypothetical protein
MMSLQAMTKNPFTLRKAGGDEIRFEGLLSDGTLVTFASRLPFEEGDSIERTLPNGFTERYRILDLGFQARLHSIPDHFQLKVQKELKPTVPVSSDTPVHVLPVAATAARKAFISYSWDDDEHTAWVHALATRLRADGVDVSIDRWSAVPGDQLPHFMERSIRENEFVVIVCTPRYKRRSDARLGGVGYEGDIMTAEVMTNQNNRKFIPVLRRGQWTEAAPIWLTGKYHINLIGDPYSDRSYEDLVRTLLCIRETAPPLGEPMATLNSGRSQEGAIGKVGPSEAFSDIQITRVLVEDVTEPRNDGTHGSALYSVPFALSRRPPGGWADLFLQSWDHPQTFTTRHRRGIASVRGATITLTGTTIEEVEEVHRNTLQSAVAEANRRYREWKTGEDRRLQAESERKEQHRLRIQSASSRIKFD